MSDSAAIAEITVKWQKMPDVWTATAEYDGQKFSASGKKKATCARKLAEMIGGHVSSAAESGDTLPQTN